MDPDTTAPPFSTDFVIELLLTGPSLRHVPPRDETARAELLAAWGRFGENVAHTWRTHEMWLRETAAARGIRPTWPGGKYFGEAVAATRRKGL